MLGGRTRLHPSAGGGGGNIMTVPLGFKHTTATKKKQRAAMIGRAKTNDHKQKLSDAAKRRWAKPDERNRQSLAQKKRWGVSS